MDLRRRLIGTLSLLLAALVSVAMLVQLSSLRDDIEAEIAASARLVEVLAALSGEADGDPAPLPATDGLRHLTLRLPGETGSPPEPSPLVEKLGLSQLAQLERDIQIGGRSVHLAPNPGSEIDERLADTVRLLITLLLYSGATLLLVWWSADRALRPVRELEQGLHRLAAGEHDPALPGFALREFSQVATAIEQLAAALNDSRAARSALARQLMTAREDERRALARDLHDEIGQSLTALSVTAAHLARNASDIDPATAAECGRDLRRDIRSCHSQLRNMLKSLRPHGLDADSLGEALRELVDHWRQRETGIDFALELPAAFPDIDEMAALTLYRVVQEALTNVVRHSGAHQCRVVIHTVDTEIRADIEDDGAGLPEAGPARRGGLLGMAERLEMAGGELKLGQRSGGGVHLMAFLPAKRAASATATGVSA